jgi:molybdopterin molybdotransferase
VSESVIQRPSTLVRPPWEQARSLAFRAARPHARPAELTTLERAAGQVLAADLVAQVALPPFSTCSMDGWAVCGPGPWRLVGRMVPGRPASSQPRLRPGEGCEVSTGTVVPDGAAGLIRSEYGMAGDGWLRAAPGRPVDLADVRPEGVEARAGDLLVASGARLTPPVLGLAASAGYDQVPVVPRPRVRVLVLGNELLTDGLPGAGRIRDGLGVQLPGWVTAAGGDCPAVTRLGDEARQLADAVRSAVAGPADVVVTTGGSARGAGDHVRTALAGLGAQVLIDGVQVRPGSPMQLARLPGGGFVVALPGNPLAALAGVVTLLWPVLAALSGARAPITVEAVAAQAISGPVGGTALVPVAPGDEPGQVRPAGYGGSSMLRGIAVASALAVVPPGGVPDGGNVSLCPLPWAGA